jgi:hypothetical protein
MALTNVPTLNPQSVCHDMSLRDAATLTRTRLGEYPIRQPTLGLLRRQWTSCNYSTNLKKNSYF